MNLPMAARTVLCVSDDRALHGGITAALVDQRATMVRTAYDGIREINRGIFDAYVLDYWLPDWSGVQLCREIRKLDPNGPVFFCMGSPREEDRRRAERAGGSAYLSKPLDPEQLRAQMTVWMELADVESIRAKLDEERAVQDEIVRRTQAVMARIAEARGNAVAAIERAARAKAYKAFIESGGTRANFDRWWPQVFGSARAASGLPGPGLP